MNVIHIEFPLTWWYKHKIRSDYGITKRKSFLILKIITLKMNKCYSNRSKTTQIRMLSLNKIITLFQNIANISCYYSLKLHLTHQIVLFFQQKLKYENRKYKNIFNHSQIISYRIMIFILLFSSVFFRFPLSPPKTSRP